MTQIEGTVVCSRFMVKLAAQYWTYNFYFVGCVEYFIILLSVCCAFNTADSDEN
jgi:hypothetical protein